jgi:hypothetical protein
MLSNSSIQNQNVINSNNISGSSSGSLLCNSLTLTDGNNTTSFNPTNTTLNNLTVNGTSNFNALSLFNSGGRVYNNAFIIAGSEFRVMDSENLNGMQAFYDSGAVTFQGIGTNSRMIFRSLGANVAFTNITLENNNHVLIEGQSGQGIDILNNQIAMNGTTTFNNQVNFNNNVNLSTYNFDITNSAKNQGMRISNNGANNGVTDFEGIGVSTRFNFFSTPATGPRVNNIAIANGNTCTLQAQTGQGIQMTDDQIAINGVTTFNNSINVNNNTITLTDGTITNTLNKSDWTGTIKTVNTTANATHYLNFSDGAGTGQGNPQKNALLSCNPSTGNITATSFNGAFFGTAANASNIALTSDNTSGTYFIPFSKTNTSSNVLYVDDVTGPLTYNPSSGLLSVASVTATGGISGLTLSGELLTSSGASPAASFTASTLTINCNFVTLRTNAFTFTGASNTVATLTINSPRNNGIYYVALQNNGTGNLIINTGLGANIKTTYSTAITVPASGSALMQINLITLNSVNSTIVDVKVLT